MQRFLFFKELLLSFVVIRIPFLRAISLTGVFLCCSIAGFGQTAQLTITPNDTVCPGDSVTISILNSTGTVYWNTGAFGNSILVFPVTDTTFYAVDDYGGANDTLYLSVRIRVIHTFIDIHPSGTWCPGDTSFFILIINPIGNILWSTGDTTNMIWISPPVTTTYWYINDEGTNCADMDSVSISIYPEAEPDISTSGNVICDGTPIIVTLNNPIGNVLWSNGDARDAIAVIPSANSVVSVINDYQGNCPDTAIITLEVIPPDIWLPDAFSPNRDNNNEEFRMYGVSPQVFHLEVYDRWGTKVFDTKNPALGWDGTFGGKDCEARVYVWTVYYQNLCSDEMMRKSGNVSLMR